jgi:hypothetical protein
LRWDRKLQATAAFTLSVGCRLDEDAKAGLFEFTICTGFCSLGVTGHLYGHTQSEVPVCMLLLWKPTGTK